MHDDFDLFLLLMLGLVVGFFLGLFVGSLLTDNDDIAGFHDVCEYEDGEAKEDVCIKNGKIILDLDEYKEKVGQ